MLLDCRLAVEPIPDFVAARAVRQRTGSDRSEHEFLGTSARAIEAVRAAAPSAVVAEAHPVIFANNRLAEGFDCPRHGRLWIGKGTGSQLLLVQRAGRALRARPGKQASAYFSPDETGARLRPALLRYDRPPLSLAP